ncbi:MAG: InlB B-repeat-containing protein, partial [Clostridiales bacterium]|nr:InlB B-repeat-containing protein [Clostridiales bacterium]
MKRMSRMVLAAILTVVMLGQMIPAPFVQAFAEGDDLFFGTMDAPNFHNVMFYDHDGTPLINDIQFVDHGEEAIPPEAPSRDGFTFTGWSPASFVVTEDTDFTAQYKANVKFEVEVNYVYANGGGAAAPTFKREYPTGVAFVAPVSVPIPSIAGYVRNINSISLQYDGINDVTATLNGGTPGAYTGSITVTYSPDSTNYNYTVRHTFEGVTNPINQTLSAQINAEISAAALPTGYSGAPAGYPGAYTLISAETNTLTGAGIVLNAVYERNYYTLSFVSNGGSTVEPIVQKYDSTVTKPANPTRQGFTFAGWFTNPALTGTAATLPSKMPAADTTYYAKWTGNSVNYTLVYWMEKPGISGDPGTNIQNYMFNKQETKSATAGSALNADSITKSAVSYATYRHGDTNVTVKGDGTTVVNVYYRRIIYTISFNLNNNSSSTRMTIGGTQYRGNSSTLYSISVKLEQDLTDIWPTSPNATFTRSGYDFTGWDMPSSNPGLGTSRWVTRRVTLTESMIPTNGNTSYTLRANWTDDDDTASFTVNYYFEQLTHETGGTRYPLLIGKYYIQSGSYSQTYTDGENNTLSPKPIEGMEATSGVERYNVGRTYHFFYERLRYTLSFNTVGGASLSSVSSIMYEDRINGYDPGWNASTTKTDQFGIVHTFEGWYKDAAYMIPFSFTGATMPNANLTLFAKWKAPEFTVRFYDGKAASGYGTLLQTTIVGARETVGDGRMPADPTNGTRVFAGWYLVNSDGSHTRYSPTLPVTSNLTIVAHWYEVSKTSYTVRYLLAGSENPVPGVSPTVVENRMVGTAVTALAKAIAGYAPDAQSKSIAALVADPAQNVIKFYYTPFTGQYQYTVQYWNAATNTLIESVGPISTSASQVTVWAKAIPNFALDEAQSYKTVALAYDAGLNVIRFNYRPFTSVTVRVEHYKEVQDPQGGIYPTNPNEYDTIPNLEVGDTAQAVAKTYDSHQYDHVVGQRRQTITKSTPSEVVIEMYYLWKRCNVAFEAGPNGSLTGTTQFPNVYWGTPWSWITVPTPVPAQGYYFAGWTPSFPGIITQDWTFTANFLPKTVITLTANSDTKEYNGTQQTVSGYTGVPAGFTITGLTASGSGTNASATAYPVTFSGTPVVRDVNDNIVPADRYTIHYIEGTVTITAKPVTITVANAQKVYGNGDPTYVDATIGEYIGDELDE